MIDERLEIRDEGLGKRDGGGWMGRITVPAPNPAPTMGGEFQGQALSSNKPSSLIFHPSSLILPPSSSFLFLF